jgi:hypothetical protein
MIVVELLLALGVITIIAIALYTGYKVGKRNDK